MSPCRYVSEAFQKVLIPKCMNCANSIFMKSSCRGLGTGTPVVTMVAIADMSGILRGGGREHAEAAHVGEVGAQWPMAQGLLCVSY